MGLLFLIAFAAGEAVSNSPQVLKAAVAPSPPPVTFKMTHLEGEPMVVRICYLDDGTREFTVPPLPVHSRDSSGTAANQNRPEEPQVVVISNTNEGTKGLVIEP